MELRGIGTFDYNREHVPVIFGRDSSLSSKLIRAALWSQWSHCGIVDHDVVIEAYPGKGVIERPVTEFIDAYPNYCLARIPTNKSLAVIEASRSQIGKPYDTLGLLGIMTRRKHLEASKAWFCSELVAWSFEQAGAPLFTIPPWRVTPADLSLPLYSY